MTKSAGELDKQLREPLRAIAWIHPIAVAIYFVVPTALAAWFYSPDVYLAQWHATKAYDGRDLAQTFLELVAFSVGIVGGIAAVRTRLKRPKDSRAVTAHETVCSADLERRFHRLYLVTAVAYAFYFATGLIRGASVGEVVELFSSSGHSASSALRGQLSAIPGITILVQLGVPVAIIGVYLILFEGKRVLRLKVLSIVLLALARSLLNSERLAIVEIVVPIAVVWVSYQRKQANRARLRVVNLAPGYIPVALLGFFATFEKQRSYTFIQDATSQSLLAYSTQRITGYYVTAYNNGALLQPVFRDRISYPYLSVQGIWDAPILGSLIEHVTKVTPESTDQAFKYVLGTSADPQFTNPGGMVTPIIDFGLPGALIFFVVIGFMIGPAYEGWRNFSPRGVAFYAFAIVGIAELPRYVYWTEGRCLPIVVGLIYLLRRPRETERRLPACSGVQRNISKPPKTSSSARK